MLNLETTSVNSELFSERGEKKSAALKFFKKDINFQDNKTSALIEVSQMLRLSQRLDPSKILQRIK